MMSLMFPLLCVVTLCDLGSAATDQACSIQDMLAFKKEWAPMFNNITERKQVIEFLWESLFIADPELKEYLERETGMDTSMNSTSMKQFTNRVMSNLDICISMLEEPMVLEQQLIYLREKHIGKRIPRKYFRYFLATLLKSVSIVTGAKINKLAWASCGTFLMEQMQDPAEKYLS